MPRQERQTHFRNFWTYAGLAALVFFWALNWPLMKSALKYAQAMDFILLRLVGAAILMVLFSRLIRMPVLPLAGERVAMGWVGFWQVGVMLIPSIVGLQFVGPGRAAVLVYTMQLWALPLGWLIARDRVSVKSAMGSLIGFAGLLIFLNPALVNWHDRRALFGNALVLCSGVGWAVGAALYRRRKWQTPQWTQTTWQIIWGAATVMVADLFAVHHRLEWRPVLIGVLAFNWIIATALCYWWWGRALTIMPASRAGQIVSLVPILALIMGAMWNGERLTPVVFVSMALIFAGIVLTVGGREAASKPPLPEETASSTEVV